jgi:hypothetical protein
LTGKRVFRKHDKGIELTTTDTARQDSRKENMEKSIQDDRQVWKNNLQPTLEAKQKGEIISKLKI